VVTVFEDADPPRSVDPTKDPDRFGLGLFGDLHLPVDHPESGGSGEFEPSDRRDITYPLMVPVMVVILHPSIQTSLSLLDRVEGVLGEKLSAEGLMKPFDLPSRGR
jgi:hypothetical protein